MSSLPIFGEQNMCLREEGRGECEVLAGESLLWRHVRKVSVIHSLASATNTDL